MENTPTTNPTTIINNTSGRTQYFKYINAALLAILIIVLLTKGCGDGYNGPTKPTIIRDTTTVVKYDTITNETISYVPEYKERVITNVIHDTIIQIEYRIEPTDTVAILEDYFARYFYEDTVVNTDSFYVIVYDTVSQNQIAGRSTRYNILYPVITNTITEKHYINAREVYLGGNIGIGTFPDVSIVNFDLGVGMRTKRNSFLLLRGGFSFPNTSTINSNGLEVRPYIGIGYFHKISKK